MCLEVYGLAPAHFSTLELAQQPSFKNTKTKLHLLTDVNILLTVRKGIRDGICHNNHRHPKVNNKNMKNYGKNKKSSYFMCCDVIVYMAEKCCQKCLEAVLSGLATPVNLVYSIVVFLVIQFKILQKTTIKIVMKGILLK